MKKTTYYKPKAKHIDFDVAILKRDTQDNYMLFISITCAVAFSFFIGYLVGKTNEAVEITRIPAPQITVDQEVYR